MADDLPVRADVALAVDAPQGEGQQPLQIRGPQIGVVQQQVPQGGGACLGGVLGGVAQEIGVGVGPVPCAVLAGGEGGEECLVEHRRVGAGRRVVGQGLVEVAVEEALVGVDGGPGVEGRLAEHAAGVGELGCGPGEVGWPVGEGGGVQEVEGHALPAGPAEDIEDRTDPGVGGGEAAAVEVEDLGDAARRLGGLGGRCGAQVFGVDGGDEEGAVVGVLGEPPGDGTDPLARVAGARTQESAQVAVEVGGKRAPFAGVAGVEVEDGLGVRGQVAAQRGQGVPPGAGAEEQPAARGVGAGGQGQQEFTEYGRGVDGLVQGVQDDQHVARPGQFLQECRGGRSGGAVLLRGRLRGVSWRLS
ncbi:hypothetical protein [Streptomyces sp. IMTB 1903]|uniref:hypothetical protein n=1 Tax=Streptomyces sp. IMTB 1903 TaxID=1776680 RepID=UPI001F3722A5|nr:hypothetical protein [Streptomyces sp. IMTB 1903]